MIANTQLSIYPYQFQLKDIFIKIILDYKDINIRLREVNKVWKKLMDEVFDKVYSEVIMTSFILQPLVCLSHYSKLAPVPFARLRFICKNILQKPHGSSYQIKLSSYSITELEETAYSFNLFTLFNKIFPLDKDPSYVKKIYSLFGKNRGELDILVDTLKQISPTTELSCLSVAREICTIFTKNKMPLAAIEFLNLNSKGLFLIPCEIVYLSSLTALSLKNNRLTSISEEICLLTQLQMLDISNNKLTSISNKISSLSSLKWLFLKNNNLNYISDDVCSLPGLKTLDLRNNKLTSIPNKIENLTSLKHLYLEDNSLTFIPDEICFLTALECLTISYHHSVKISRKTHRFIFKKSVPAI